MRRLWLLFNLLMRIRNLLWCINYFSMSWTSIMLFLIRGVIRWNLWGRFISMLVLILVWFKIVAKIRLSLNKKDRLKIPLFKVVLFLDLVAVAILVELFLFLSMVVILEKLNELIWNFYLFMMVGYMLIIVVSSIIIASN